MVVQCPQCQKALRVRDSLAGRKMTIKCPGCGEIITVPGASEEAVYCRECGKQMPGDSKFCPKCGTARATGDGQAAAPAVPAAPAIPDSGEPLLVLKPVLIPWVAIGSAFQAQMFFTLWGCLFLGGFGALAVNALKLPLPIWFTFAFFGCLFFFGIPLLVYYAKKRTYEKTTYRFYADRLEYAEGFFTAENKTIRYDRIAETAMRRGIMQRRYGLGTIFLSTPATGFYEASRDRSGIRVADVEEPEKVYEVIQELIGA